MDEYYIIQTEVLSNNRIKKINYYVSILYDEDNYISVKFGNYRTTPCIEITFQNDSEVAILQNISNDIKCTILEDTSIHEHDIIILIKISLNFIVSKYLHIKHFTFTDNSTIYCSDKIKICLADLSFIKYHHTWYEKNLGSIPDESNVLTIKFAKQQILENINKKININKKNFIGLNKEYLIKNKIEEDKIDTIIKEIKKIFYEGISVYDYLFLFISKNIECIYYSYLFNFFITNFLLGTSWIITKETILKYRIKYSYLTSKKKLSHKNIIKRVKIFNNNKLKETKTYNYIEGSENVTYN